MDFSSYVIKNFSLERFPPRLEQQELSDAQITWFCPSSQKNLHIIWKWAQNLVLLHTGVFLLQTSLSHIRDLTFFSWQAKFLNRDLIFISMSLRRSQYLYQKHVLFYKHFSDVIVRHSGGHRDRIGRMIIFLCGRHSRPRYHFSMRERRSSEYLRKNK